MVNCPYGQFISTLWRGKESRENLKIHVLLHYEELNDMVKNGLNIKLGNKTVLFNVIVFLVGDLSFTKEILGRCSSTHTYGCNHCQLSIQEWSKKKLVTGQPQTINSMTKK